MNVPVFNLEAPKASRAEVQWRLVLGPVEGGRLRVMSLGAGVQSTTLALISAHGSGVVRALRAEGLSLHVCGRSGAGVARHPLYSLGAGRPLQPWTAAASIEAAD